MSEHFNPLTGEIITTPNEARAALDRVEDQLGSLYDARRILTDALTDLVPQIKPPLARHRTEIQQRAMLCPSCKRRYKP